MSFDSSVLKIALPRTGKETHLAFGSTKDGVKKMASHSMHLVPEKNELDSRLRSSRAHGQRLHCEVLGSETCQKCIRILDQTSVENKCPLCTPFEQKYGSLAHPDFRKRQSAYSERGSFTGNVPYTPVQIFHRVREKESDDERITRKRFRFQGEQPRDQILTNKHTMSHLPSNLPALLVSRNDSACISEEAEEEVGTNCELKVRVTFGNTSLSTP
ncbi:organic cation transporter protein [Plakobranchus ocellatus]|uniref:Organic cation transporter protein n=1 Tax=Plakobranchus ocellatus TaxID=259542 RepID=A0AAV4B4W4_9GAST|nr:organic cation transporter protein [Plakobranchus ocellatus]